jgi:hypothetical protein
MGEVEVDSGDDGNGNSQPQLPQGQPLSGESSSGGPSSGGPSSGGASQQTGPKPKKMKK